MFVCVILYRLCLDQPPRGTRACVSVETRVCSHLLYCVVLHLGAEHVTVYEVTLAFIITVDFT